MIYSTERTMEELGDKATPEQKDRINEALESLKEAVKGDDVEKVKGEIEALGKALHEVTTALYQQVAAEQAAQGQAQATDEQPPGDEGDVVDADFKEVKDDE
jgi:molecular chaperone DnaK